MSPRKPAKSSSVEHPMSADMIEAVADRFRALGEPGRLRLLEYLCRGPMSVGDLAEATGQSHANTSKHLSVLAATGFVARRREGNRVLYDLADDTTQNLCTVICDHVLKTAEAELNRIRPRRAPS